MLSSVEYFRFQCSAISLTLTGCQWALYQNKVSCYNAITNKVNHSLTHLCPNLRAVSGPVKHQAFITLVRPKLKYCSSVWDSHCLSQDSLLEFIQNCAARFITNNFPFPFRMSCPFKLNYYYYPSNSLFGYQNYDEGLSVFVYFSNFTTVSTVPELHTTSFIHSAGDITP